MRVRINSYDSAISGNEIKYLPLTSFNGEIIVVDDLKAVYQAVEMLRSCDLLGFDTETKPAFRKGVVNRVALLQLASKDRAFIFRLNKTGLPSSLASILADNSILKVGAAIKDDIRSLRKLTRFIPGGFVELQDFVKKFNIADNGLRKLAGIVLGVQISKSQQVSNWERDELTNAQLIYAATDAWICHEIYRKLISGC